ncbi:MAG: chromosome segregation protein SMC [Candidatus Polarisedimenticolia bacterium]
MLRLEKLEMIGFKSFLSRTEFHFDQAITAVVGPNGCGKSNIGDALNWVIGEQSVKSLRGDRMEDVIFNGSEGRKPLGMAEVSLHLRNGAGGEAEDKVVLTRRLFRSGESEYLINGERSRLRDVQETLARVNVGSGVYSIIEQGKVDAALSSRPRERRLLIEEAAGIALYKTRKRQAETKLEATQANLLRVNDIVVELEKQIGSLKRQAARARRYGRVADDIARHERILLFHDHARLEGERSQIAAREDEARAREIEASGRLGTLEAGFEERRRILEADDAAWRARRDELHATDREMDRIERDRALAGDQAEEAAANAEAAREQGRGLAARLSELAAEIEGQRIIRSDVERQVSGTDAERARLDEARGALEDRIAALESALAGGRASFLQVVDALSDARHRIRQIEQARQKQGVQGGALDREQALALETLRRLEAEASQAREAAESAAREADELNRALSARREELQRLEETLARESTRREEARHRLHGQRERLRALEEIQSTQVTARELLDGLVPHAGLVSDRMKAPADLETAIETYLSAQLDAAVMEGRAGALEAIRSLKSSGRGRAAFLSLDESQGPAPVVALPDEVRADPGFVGRLLDLVETGDAERAALGPALARALVVSDLETAARLRRIAPFFDYVTREGDVLHTNGLVEGGAPRPEGTGVLTRRRLMADLATDIAAGASHLDALDRLVEGLTQDSGSAQERVEAMAADLSEREKGLVAAQHASRTADDEAERGRARTEMLVHERRAMDEEDAALAQEMERLAATLRDLEEARRKRETQMTETQDEIAALRVASAKAGEDLAQVRATLSAARQRLESIDVGLARLLESDQDLRDRIDAGNARAVEQEERRQDALRRREEAASALADLSARRDALQHSVREGEVDLAERRLALEAAGQELRAARTALEEARAARESVTLERERVAGDLRHLMAGLERPFEEEMALLTDEDRAMDQEAGRAALGRLRALRDQMGPVNMMALDQFRELEERHTFLVTQRNDLTEAVASLRQTIANINRASRERFLEAFEHIRGGFIELFKTLFGGGRADLRLLTGDGEEDVLECGLEIVAQPPGKRLQSVSLLSGGEKALTAISLLFAIFKYRPSPFCLLDEVDAPLDEANVLRFNDLLRTMSASTQFVMITHNRRSMENADMLYGITMEEAGVSRSVSVVVDGSTDKVEAVRSLPSLLAARHKGAARSLGARPTTPRNGNATPDSGILPL